MGNGLIIDNSTYESGPWRNGEGYNCSFELYPKHKTKEHVIFSGTAATFSVKFMTWCDPTKVVVKAKRQGSPRQDYVWREGYLHCYKTSESFVAPFNAFLREHGRCERVHITEPTIARMKNISDFMPITRCFKRFGKLLLRHEFVLFEEHLQGDFEIFTFANGCLGLGGNYVVEAFGHFAFHHSCGDLVLCKIRGVSSNGVYHLVTPRIHSMTMRYGNQDAGEIGIAEFFQHHICNSLCRALRVWQEQPQLISV